MPERKHLDCRVMDRYLKKGLLKEADLASHMKGLPDETPNAQWVQVDVHDTELGESMSDDSSEEAT